MELERGDAGDIYGEGIYRAGRDDFGIPHFLAVGYDGGLHGLVRGGELAVRLLPAHHAAAEVHLPARVCFAEGHSGHEGVHEAASVARVARVAQQTGGGEGL